jgi:hypothetical protein
MIRGLPQDRKTREAAKHVSLAGVAHTQVLVMPRSFEVSSWLPIRHRLGFCCSPARWLQPVNAKSFAPSGAIRTPLTPDKRNDYPSARMRIESSEARRRIEVAREGHATNRSCLTARLFQKPNGLRWVFRGALSPSFCQTGQDLCLSASERGRKEAVKAPSQPMRWNCATQ